MASLLTFLLAIPSADAAVSDLVYTSLVHREIEIELENGMAVAGELVGVGDHTIVVLTRTGRTVEIAKGDVGEVRAGRGAPSSSTTPAECVWAGADELDVRATMTRVTINGETYPVRGRKAREDFADLLDACDADGAADEFRRWRALRRGTNVAFGLSFVPMGPLGVIPVAAAATQAVIAGNVKQAMIDEIEDSIDERTLARR